jgi:hypothetical protein
MFARVPWQKVWSEPINVGAATTARGFFPLPTLNLFATFRLVISAFTSGSVIVFLRFGFRTADALLSLNGIDFPILAALNTSNTRSVVFDTAAVLPGCVGSPPGILPPLGSVAITSGVATILTYDIHMTCISGD